MVKDVDEYQNQKLDELEGVVKQYTQGGWDIVEYSTGYVEMVKPFYSPNVLFSASGGIFSATLEASAFGGGEFPFALKSIKNIGLNDVPVLGTSSANFWGDGINFSSQGVTSVRLSSDIQTRRDLRFVIEVKGYK